jgi:SsrA-binding protein
VVLCYDVDDMTPTSKSASRQGFKPSSRQGDKPATRNFALNRQAGHYYHLFEKFEAGIELTGTEVKSIREGKANLKDSYAVVRDGEVWLIDCHVAAYAAGSYLNADSLRDRRLLLRRQEIDKLGGRTRERGLTIVPLRLYLKNNLIKCEIALAKGKTVWDQRETLRRRTIDRETEQAMREHRRRR